MNFLLDHQVDIEKKDDFGRSAADIAQLLGRQKIFEMLTVFQKKKRGIKMNGDSPTAV